MSDKHSLRVDLRNRRKLIENTKLFWPDDGQDLPAPFIRALGPASIVAAYVKSGSEADPSGLVGRISRMGKTIALPWLAGRGAALQFREWRPGDQLEAAPFGFDQPAGSAAALAPDLILAPLLGFDRAMNRLGQGAGHYDRAFAQWPGAIRIGLAWSVQECSALTPDPWDVPLDAVLTEKEWITGPKSRIRA